MCHETRVQTIDFDDVLHTIQTEFKPEPIVNEEDLEKQLTVFLKAKGINVKRQHRPDGRLCVDILLKGEYGLELKIVDSSKKLEELIGQLMTYRKLLKDCAAVVVTPPEQREKLEAYIHMVREDGLKFVIIETEIKR